MTNTTTEQAAESRENPPAHKAVKKRLVALLFSDKPTADRFRELLPPRPRRPEVGIAATCTRWELGVDEIALLVNPVFGVLAEDGVLAKDKFGHPLVRVSVADLTPVTEQRSTPVDAETINAYFDTAKKLAWDAQGRPFPKSADDFVKAWAANWDELGNYPDSTWLASRMEKSLRALPWKIPHDHEFSRRLLKAMLSRLVEFGSMDIDKWSGVIATPLRKWSPDDPAESRSDGWGGLYRTEFRADFVNEFGSVLESSEESPQELIAGLLFERQPGMIGGLEKTCKSILAADATAGLVTGTTFLGRRAKQTNVWMSTLETVAGDFSNKVRAAIAARGLDPDEYADRYRVTSDPKVLRDPGMREKLTTFLLWSKTKVAVLDPLYLIDPGKATTDMSQRGKRLRRLVEPITDADCTPLFCHHFTKTVSDGELPGIDNLAGAGVAQYVRSWVLVNRKARYDGGKVHDLLGVVGTSCGGGHHGELAIRVDERPDASGEPGLKVTASPLNVAHVPPSPKVPARAGGTARRVPAPPNGKRGER